jgi:DNA-damage-inducible protein J
MLPVLDLYHVIIFTVAFVAHLSYINIRLTNFIVMSKKTATVRARMEPGLKKETERILDQLGLNTTEAIRIFFKQVKLQRGLPFELKIPNETTQQAITDAKERKDLKEFKTPEEVFEDLDI